VTITAPSAPDATLDPAPADGQSVDVRPQRRWRRWVFGVLALVLLPTAWSYAGYLTAPGDAPVAVRTSDWLRDHGFQSVVDRVEQWWYTRSPPKGAHPARTELPVGLPHPDQWVDVRGLAVPVGSVQEEYLQPDPAHPSVAATLVRVDQTATRLVLVPGTKEPGGRSWAWHSQIPGAERHKAVAAFNAGFKFSDTRGGMYTERRHAVRRLQPGLASLVISSNGMATVAQWGRDATMSRHVASVRQNLALIVDGGRPAPGLSSDKGGRWGSRRSQFQYCWRSGLGIDAQNRLVYVAGDHLTLHALATALIEAGAIRAMQLDIHNGVVSFNWYRPSGSGVSASKLVPAMDRSATRFLNPDERDFFALMSR
jgi:hypothetical protein